jgi:hypothetical protein
VTIPFVYRPPLRVRPAGYALVVCGSLIALFSLVGLTWYSFSGPNVVSDPSLANVPPEGIVMVIRPADAPSQHSIVFWAIFGLCVISALAAGLPNVRWHFAARIAAPTLAVLLIGRAIIQVVGDHLLTEPADGFPPGTRSGVGAGFWVGIVGIALIGVGAVLGPRRTLT